MIKVHIYKIKVEKLPHILIPRSCSTVKMPEITALGTIQNPLEFAQTVDADLA